MNARNHEALGQPLELPCGVVLKNRLLKSAMSDSLGDGCGNPTNTQIRLYQRWANGGAAALIVGEVQTSPNFAEKPGNLVLHSGSNLTLFEELAVQGSTDNTQLWLQLGQAGAMAYPPISTPKGPSAIEIPGLSCAALSREEVRGIPLEFASTALMAQKLGFGGVQIHAAHGFLLSQFLSPLFNKRRDEYGGSIDSRMRLLIEVVNHVRDTVDDHFVVAVKLNATDQLDGGLETRDALEVVSALNDTGIDIIDISGGTYFPGAKSASDASTNGPYFLDFAKQARKRTDKPLMVTGGFKRLEQSVNAVAGGDADLVGLARALVVDPELPNRWLNNQRANPTFPRFSSPPTGGVTAWYTMRLTQIGQDRDSEDLPSLDATIKLYEDRDKERVYVWNEHFKNR